MGYQVGDEYWKQLSMWEFAPKPCVEKFVTEGQHTFHYCLVKVVEVYPDGSWRAEKVFP